MTEQSFFGSGFFDWQRSGAEHYRHLYEITQYDPDTYWGGFSRDSVPDDYTLPGWAIGPFEKHSANPVFGPAAEGWDRGRFGGGVHNGAVLHREGAFHYLYRGEEPIPEDFWGGEAAGATDMQEIDYICDIGLATSTDGLSFTRDTEHSPFFRTGDDRAFSFEDTCVVEHEGRYYLFCNKWDWKDHDNPHKSGAFVAVSDDMRHWQSHGLVFPEADHIHRNPVILQDPANRAVAVDGRFVMYLNNGLIAYSEDLLHWESKSVENLWPGGEGCFALAHHSVDHPNDIVLFTGGHHTGHFYAIGEVRLSLSDPETALEWLPRPVLIAEDRFPWEDARSVDDPDQLVSPFRDTIFFTGMTLHDGHWWMYYGGSEVYTCLATTKNSHTPLAATRRGE
jgi:predicted GH43/DUF377 family glycosyl hydrolase